MDSGSAQDQFGCCSVNHEEPLKILKCKCCETKYHARCVGIDEITAHYIHEYYCVHCEPQLGPTTFKEKRNEHRVDPFLVDDNMSLPVETGTIKFLQELMKRKFHSSEGIVRYMTGDQLTPEYFERNGFNKPIIVEKIDSSLGIRVPPSNFSFSDVERILGPDYGIEVIHSTTQSTHRMLLSEFIKYFKTRTEILNSLSVEFSFTTLSSYVEAPQIVRELDWATKVWPSNYKENRSVQKYVIMSMKNSFTDFHIDFGGSSVWYHILKGRKVFYIIPPTPSNLSFYQTWQRSEKQKEKFFGDQVDFTYQCIVDAGNTLLLPSGWIHAVYTPDDSLVFGGNFLHSYAIPMQIRVYEIERNTDLGDKLMYPCFEAINWFAAPNLVAQIAQCNANQGSVPYIVLQGAKSLIQILKQWNQERGQLKGQHEPVPAGIDPQKLIKDLNREVRQADRIQNTLNPPKPERESKRQKRKPMDKDFVDISQSRKFQNFQPKTPLKSNVKALNKNMLQPTQPQPGSIKLTLPKPSTLPCFGPVFNKASVDQHIDGKSEHVDGKSTVLRIKLVNRPAVADSVYDFHESDDEQLHIDERPKKLRNKRKVLSISTGQEQNNTEIEHEIEIAAEVDIESEAPKNGIDELLKASTFGIEGTLQVPKGFSVEPGSPSNNTSDAIDGILAIGSTHGADKHGFLSSGAQHKKKWPGAASSIQEEDEPMTKVHQDDSFVYFALDYSDGEEHVFKPRGKRKMDEAWNPKARVGHVTPKTDRPIREGTKKQSVEKCLEAAAAKRVGIAEPKRTYIRRKPKVLPTTLLTASTSATSTLAASTSVILPSVRKSEKVKKPKKGMATVKQRLGKKLKIHRMTF